MTWYCKCPLEHLSLLGYDSDTHDAFVSPNYKTYLMLLLSRLKTILTKSLSWHGSNKYNLKSLYHVWQIASCPSGLSFSCSNSFHQPSLSSLGSGNGASAVSSSSGSFASLSLSLISLAKLSPIIVCLHCDI